MMVIDRGGVVVVVEGEEEEEEKDDEGDQCVIGVVNYTRATKWGEYLWWNTKANLTSADSARLIWPSLKISFLGVYTVEEKKLMCSRESRIFACNDFQSMRIGLWFRVNVFVGPAKDNVYLSRTVTEIFCCCCGQMVGWKFEAAPRKHREGLFLLEWGRIIEFEESVNNHEIDADKPRFS
ncbi:yippee-like-like protein [Drosera capensis]